MSSTFGFFFYNPVWTPYLHVVIAVAGQINIFTAYGYYTSPARTIEQYLAESPIRASLEDPLITVLFTIMCIISLPLTFDLLLDVIGYVWSMRNPQENVPIEERNELTPLVVCAKEWIMRLMYIIAAGIPSIVLILESKNEYKPILFMMLSYMRFITLGCMSMMSLTDTFDSTPYEYMRSLLWSIFFTFSQILMFCGNAVEQSYPQYIWYTFSKVLAGILCGIYLYQHMFHTRYILKRLHWGKLIREITTKELYYMIYSNILTCGSLTCMVILTPVNFDGYKISKTDIIAHEITIILYALVTSSLPVRIARIEGRRARNMVVNTKQNVSHTLNAPLRVVLSELDLMLSDEGVMNTMNSTGLQRMVRIACACDKAVDALQKVADMSDDDGSSRLGSIRGSGVGVRGQGLGVGHYMTPPSHESDPPISHEHSSENDDHPVDQQEVDSHHSRNSRVGRRGSRIGLAFGLGLIPIDHDEIDDLGHDLGGPTPDINLSATIALQRVGVRLDANEIELKPQWRSSTSRLNHPSSFITSDHHRPTNHIASNRTLQPKIPSIPSGVSGIPSLTQGIQEVRRSQIPFLDEKKEVNGTKKGGMESMKGGFSVTAARERFMKMIRDSPGVSQGDDRYVNDMNPNQDMDKDHNNYNNNHNNNYNNNRYNKYHHIYNDTNNQWDRRLQALASSHIHTPHQTAAFRDGLYHPQDGQSSLSRNSLPSSNTMSFKSKSSLKSAKLSSISGESSVNDNHITLPKLSTHENYQIPRFITKLQSVVRSSSVLGSGSETAGTGTISVARSGMGTERGSESTPFPPLVGTSSISMDGHDENTSPSENIKEIIVYGEDDDVRGEGEGREETMVRSNVGLGTELGVGFGKGIVEQVPLSTNSDDSMMVHSHQTNNGSHSNGSIEIEVHRLSNNNNHNNMIISNNNNNNNNNILNNTKSSDAMAASSVLSIAESAIRKSETLQLQGNITVAVLEVQSALTRLQEGKSRFNTGASTNGSISGSSSAVDVVDKTWSHSCALCHRRLGVLYKLMGRYEDAESSIRLYIAHLENNQGNIHNGNNETIHTKQTQEQDDSMHDLDMNLEQDLAVAYTLLSTIIGLSSDERSVEARQNDIRAGMLMETHRSSPRNSQKESSPFLIHE